MTNREVTMAKATMVHIINCSRQCAREDIDQACLDIGWAGGKHDIMVTCHIIARHNDHGGQKSISH